MTYSEPGCDFFHLKSPGNLHPMAVIAPSEPGGHSQGSVPSPDNRFGRDACHSVTGIAEAWT